MTNGIRARLVDLMVVIQKGVYYPEFMGSFNIKKTAPAILGESVCYSNLEIGDGVEAMLAFDKLIKLPDCSPDKKSLDSAMREYCARDTGLMVKLNKWLNEQR